MLGFCYAQLWDNIGACLYTSSKQHMYDYLCSHRKQRTSLRKEKNRQQTRLLRSVSNVGLLFCAKQRQHWCLFCQPKRTQRDLHLIENKESVIQKVTQLADKTLVEICPMLGFCFAQSRADAAVAPTPTADLDH